MAVRRRGLAVDVGEEYGRALGGEAAGRGRADAAGPAGDQRGVAVETAGIGTVPAVVAVVAVTGVVAVPVPQVCRVVAIGSA